MTTIALAAGGTGGHMFPAESLAAEAKGRGWRILLLTDERGLRYADDFPADEIVVLPAGSPSVGGAVKKAAAMGNLARGFYDARNALGQIEADVAVGFGGYPSAPGLAAAWTRGIPFGIHEQNAILGRVNRRAAPRARFVAHGFARLDGLPGKARDPVETGNPVRPAVKRAATIDYDPPSGEGPIHLLVFGGSQGASLFARAFPPALAALPEPLRKRLRVTHQVADTGREALARLYDQAGIQAELGAFFTDLPERIARSHFVIARAGASTVTELAVIGRPCLLVPLAIAMDDHQRVNASFLERAGAADVLLETELDEQRIRGLLQSRLSDGAGLAARAKRAEGSVKSGASAALADLAWRAFEEHAARS